MTQQIAFIDLAAQRQRLKDRLDEAVMKVLDEGHYINGPEVAVLEAELIKFGHAEYGQCCANGTDALVLPLMAWGVRPGDAVFVPSFTFASTAEVVPWLGATPIFVDIDPDTYTMDAEALSAAIEQVVQDGRLKPRAVIAVDLFGQPADYPTLSEISKRHGLKLIADSAQGFGCTLSGHHPLHWADVATISFYPAKPLGGYGDGGALLTNDKALHNVIRSLRDHGAGKVRYEYDRIGMNSRLDTLQAAILLVKLSVFQEEIDLRNRVADRYAAELTSEVKTPKVIEGGISTWAQYTIETDQREALRAHLAERGVPSAVYYPIPLHLQSPYADFPIGPKGMAATEAAAPKVVSLPMHPDMSQADQTQVIKAINSFNG
ncbi:DegT/DnrJ/EryC1/StrS aminotransferase family protein [Hyphobacterium sp. CCMP332]|uniref:DegT/DnrJ/EryC1/StrS family aminotransferase n=1 Tax=Hyphobacterium sp. CCMP332 TaxID=2749086 RepID=UPI00164F746E|nr:DegT/DnrJ/EryC1/StrS aminotransferase family protein [Hyphobacterium sp. CCMP332]QNL17867.1 DegT/DnrJ/EryC1/StrS aminotransferase family protein [Hyphobacterium sp. CCMP332]